MSRYIVHLINTVSTAIEVEADDPETAIDAAYNSPRMPGRMTSQAFGSASVDESGDWEPASVSDQDGEEVWSASLESDLDVAAVTVPDEHF